LVTAPANVDRFSKYFHVLIREEIIYDLQQTFLPHLSYVATLRYHAKFKNSKLLPNVCFYH